MFSNFNLDVRVPDTIGMVYIPDTNVVYVRRKMSNNRLYSTILAPPKASWARRDSTALISSLVSP